ncbi:Cyclin [Rasamsonia emersonii CBS 393.64]|uniref:Cyclin n=1 Tax=Rasamsonia emersonii (strain ATCC 16479 / CBS 393.64 / IMI 116815) TaxID=1408163 RepID=A0A0F4YS76_RASE3|nr:Cyclin [Rasamsonia emersonii CBS 393.64]KKA20483.1 Cyclin [Rasamsonia emersonii CBS 393.64]
MASARNDPARPEGANSSKQGQGQGQSQGQNQGPPDEANKKPSQPHPSFIQVAKPYVFEQTIQECLAATGVDPQREDSIRIQGVTWIDNVRKALHLPVRTYNTACVYFHKFRLVHADNHYNYMVGICCHCPDQVTDCRQDAAAAALFTACKIEDTLKKSREIVCAAYNLKLPPAEHLAPDDSLFDAHSRGIIILERLMLEASGFDFRNRHPQKLLVKLCKRYGVQRDDEVGLVAYCVSLDLYRTFAPLKQTTATMAFACLELASRLVGAGLDDVESGKDYENWKIGRAEVMETLLDLLDLYTNHRTNTAVGPEFPLEAFLTIRIPLNQEAESKNLPRYTFWKEKEKEKEKDNLFSNGSKHHHHHHHKNPTPKGKEKDGGDRDTRPANPLTPISANGEKPNLNERGRDGTVRFMLDPDRAEAEKRVVSEYFREEVEEYVVDEE